MRKKEKINNNTTSWLKGLLRSGLQEGRLQHNNIISHKNLSLRKPDWIALLIADPPPDNSTTPPLKFFNSSEESLKLSALGGD